MKTLKNLLLLIVSTIFLSGCYYTIEPVYFEKDKITDDAIIGNWYQPDKKDKWSFEKNEGANTYSFVYVDSEGVESTFNAVLTKIGKHKYFDIVVDKKRIKNQNGLFRALFLECHFFIRYSIENDKLLFTNYDLTWIKKKLENKEINLHFFIREGGYYFSDSTENLQKVIISLEDTKEAFSKEAATTLERVK